MSETSEPHLRDDVLAAYLDRALDAPARASADTHLAQCAACRDELVALSALARSNERRRPVWRIGAPLAAVAATLLIAVLSPWRTARDPGRLSGDRLRETTTVTGARLRVVAPVDGTTLRADSIRFTWRRERGDAAYHLTLSDESGGVLWPFDTSDTTTALPPSVGLKAGRVYYWYVDAIGSDGRTRATGISRFRVAP